jgi:hypothetical protein
MRRIFILRQCKYMHAQAIYIIRSAMQLPATDRHETDGSSQFEHMYNRQMKLGNMQNR